MFFQNKSSTEREINVLEPSHASYPLTHKCEIVSTSETSKEKTNSAFSKDTTSKDSNSISSKDSSNPIQNPTNKPVQNIILPPFNPLLASDDSKEKAISFKSNINNQNEEKISSFKAVKVYYCDNLTQGRKIFENYPKEEPLNINEIEEPTILHLESYQPRMKIIQRHNLITSNKTCTCSKTKCLKKYCECLANNQYCFNCNCVDCHNLPEYQQEKYKEETEEITCTCTKSNCNKKYCECYKTGRKCNDNCRCINCLNKQDGNSTIEALNKDRRKKNKNIDSFIMERISVLIERGVITIEKKIIDIEPQIKKEKNSNRLLQHKRPRFLFHMDNTNKD